MQGKILAKSNLSEKGDFNMKYYLIEEHSVATPENHNFNGQESFALKGKNDYLVSYTGSHPENLFCVKKLWMSDVIEYGYTRKCDAKRNWTYKNPENTKYWKSTVKIVEIEC